MNLHAVIHRWWSGLVVGLALSLVCSSSSASPGPALDFESSTHWALREGAGPISLSAEASNGEHSLEVGGSGWRRIGSVPLSTVGAQENTVWLDVEPTQAPQAWEGVGLALRIGSLQLWWADLGTNSIAGLAPGEFSTLAFTLPEAVRSQLNASYADLEVLITVNSAAPVRLDHLRFSSQPPAGGEADPPSDAGSPTLVCDPDRSDLQIIAVDGDLKDLWAGREEAATGKRTSVRPSVGVTFSAPIDAARLSARFSPVTCSGYPIAAVPEEAVSFWPAPATTATVSPSLPGGFGIIAWNWVDGVSQSDGPIAAGQGVRLSSFSVNGQTNQRTAIAAGSLDLTNGTIFGDVLTPTATTIAPPYPS